MGLPVVALHGFLGSPTAWEPTFRELERLSPTRRRILLPILPGHEPNWPRSMRSVGWALDHTQRVPLASTALGLAPTFAQQADAILKALEPCRGPFHLLGYSLGARLALAMLWRRPARFASALLLSGHTGLPEPRARTARQLNDEAWCSRLLEQPLPAFLERWEQQPLLKPTSRTDREYLRSRRGARLQLAPEGLRSSLRHAGLGNMPALAHVLVSYAGRVRVLVGSCDRRFRDLYERLERGFPGSLDVREIAPAGHDLLGEGSPEIAAQALDLWRRTEHLG